MVRRAQGDAPRRRVARERKRPVQLAPGAAQRQHGRVRAAPDSDVRRPRARERGGRGVRVPGCGARAREERVRGLRRRDARPLQVVHYLTRRRRALRGIVVARGAAAPFAHDTGDAREEICARLRVGTERAGRAVLRRPVFLEGRPPVRVCGRPLMRCHFWPMPFMLKTYDL